MTTSSPTRSPRQGDNATFGSPDESYVLASPDDVGSSAGVTLDLSHDDVLSTPTADKVTLALELEAAVRVADPLVRRRRVCRLRRRRGRSRG